MIFQDRFTAWAVAGVLGSMMRELCGLIALWTGIAKIHIAHLGADMYTNDILLVKSPLGVIIGLVNDWIFGAVLGVTIGLVINWSGERNYLLKGIGVGLLSWVAIFGFLIHGVPHMFSVAPKDLETIATSVVLHSIFGGSTAFLVTRFLK